MVTKDNMCSVKTDFLSYAVENWNQSSSHPSDPEVGEKVIGHLHKNYIHYHSLHLTRASVLNLLYFCLDPPIRP